MNKNSIIIIMGILIVASFFLGFYIKSSEIRELQEQITILKEQNEQHLQNISTNISQDNTKKRDCCTEEQIKKGFKCIPDCGPPTIEYGVDYKTSSSCLSPKQIEEREFYGCPICLSYNTKISTPNGEVRVDEIELGMLVWTVDNTGLKVAQPVLKISSSFVASDHKMVHIILKDGREISVSPKHPTVVGITAGELKVGDIYDGSIVVGADLEQYQNDKTYDLLPAGETGYYWGDGILIGSTLKRS